MKHTITFLTFFLISNIYLFSQAPQWSWAKRAGGTLDDYFWNSTVDIYGNLYATGEFASSSITFGNNTFTNAGGIDFLIVKYNAHGNVIWARQAGSSGSETGYYITTDAVGKIYVTGYFSGSSITFGNITLTNANPGNPNVFIAKYDTAGNVLWAQKAGGKNDDRGRSVATDLFGNLYLLGDFSSDTITFGSINLINSGIDDYFIVKFDTSGNVKWARQAGGTGDDLSKCITTDINGNVYITGEFYSPTFTIGSFNLTNAGVSDMLIAKIDSSGNVIWARRAGSTGDDCSNSIITDGSGNSYILGEFDSPTILFGSNLLTNASGAFDLFIAKYDSSGNVVWAKRAGGTADEYARSITKDNIGNLFITGWFESTNITFGFSTFNNQGTLGDIYMAKFDTAGNALWARSAGSTDVDRGYSIGIDPHDNLLITGFFRSPSIIFGNDTLYNANPGNDDILIAKIPSKLLVGIQDIRFENLFSVFPNPTNGDLWITVPFPAKNIKIYNDKGELTQNENINEKTELHFQINENGLYFVQIITDKEIITKKIIVNK